MKKKVVVQLPRQANLKDLRVRYALELEALDSVAEIVEVDASTEEAFIEGARDADALLTSWGINISRNIIESLEKCVVIGVGSVGVDMVDVDAATENGIVVTNTPDIFIEEVADHALALMLACYRQLKTQDTLAREGRWYEGRPKLNDTPRLIGQTLGVLAYGNVAQATVRRAKAFGMHVISYDPYVSEIKMTREGVEPVSFDELMARSDYLSLHCLLNDETRHIMNADAFKKMKNTAYLINTCRGGVVNEKDLIAALANGELAGAGLDVLEQEPPAADNPLFAMENVIITPHSASATSRMRPETRRRAAREIALALRGKWPMSPVNPTVMPKVSLERWQPYPMERGPNR
ncbi:MAG: C-terminal binding protein [Proteobacteria bacterium]|jgi:D-3-phosphoglycerate dehydrogenase|nr:C-terminal binding protein [Pseudomonadota bacterium]MDA1300058.1 C-terminal binding protein [Pseudomonadota bacterium]